MRVWRKNRVQFTPGVHWVVFSHTRSIFGHTEYTRNRDYVIAPSGQSANFIGRQKEDRDSLVTH